MAVVDELVTLLGLETDPAAEGEAKNFNNLLGGVRKASLAAGTALVALTGASFAVAKQFAATADESGKFAASVDINLKKLEELEFAAQRVGGSSSELRGDLASLADQFGSADRGIDALIQQFDGLSDEEARLAGATFGISETTLRLLREGSDGVAALRAEFRELGGGLPDDAAERAAEFNDQWLNLTTTVAGIAGTVQVALLPAFSSATQGLREFLVNNRELISSGLETFIAGVQKGFSDFGAIIDSIVDFIRPLLGEIGSLTEGLEFVDIIGNLVTATLVTFAALLTPLAIKIAAIAAALIAVGVAIDDVITFFKGGDSVIGRFFDAFEERFPALFALFEAWFGLLRGGFDLLVEGVKLVADAVASLIPDIGGLAEGALDLINSGAELLGFGGDDTASAANGAAAAVPASVVNNTTNSQGGSTVNVTQNITGAGDPRGVASESTQRLGSAVQTLSPGQRAPRVS